MLLNALDKSIFMHKTKQLHINSFVANASRREPMVEPTALEMICQFNKLKPPKFGGGTDLLAYEE